MKTISLAVALLISSSQASRLTYEESEGPTKVDFGDSDQHIMGRDRDSDDYLSKMKPKFHGWSNPLSWTDGGDDDDKILTQVRTEQGFDEAEEDAMIAQMQADIKMTRPNKKNKKDAYDGDHTTVSPYDNMEHHTYLPKYDEDCGNPMAGFEGAQINSMA